MPFERGGLADKLGNRYEGRWLATWLLRLLNEKVQSVTVEAIGDDEQGVDIWIVENDGVRQAHQCKANNGSKESWDVSDLDARGVLAKLKFQLDRGDDSNKFFFVSSVGSNKLQSICEFARRSQGNPVLFFEEKIEKSSKDVRECFVKFCSYLSLQSEKQEDRSRAFNYLKRIYVTVFPDDYGAWQNLLDTADSLLVGDSEVAIGTLLSYVTNNNLFGSPIYADELRGYLVERGIHPKRLAHDSRIAPTIETLQREFADSILPQLIGGAPIQRHATTELVSAIYDQKNILLIGSAGTGKSGVLYELTENLNTADIPYLPIRLDRRVPEDNAAQFGHDLGLPDCPVYSLAALAGSRQGVLIIDQLDAIRWTSSHADNALAVCKELVRHIEQQRQEGKKISIVLCCRKFDLEHDAAIKNWLNGSDTQEFVTIEVGALNEEEVKRFVGKSYANRPIKEKNLLAIPFNLSIWLELSLSGPVPVFRSATDLMREFWKNRRIILEKQSSIAADQLDQALSPLLDFVERNGRISAPERVIGRYPRVADALYSYGILQRSAGQITFCHQRYLDYLIAERLIAQIYSGSGSILEWLGTKDKQSLFRREQLRQALVLLAEDLPTRFLSAIEQLLFSEQVRFHIKHLVLELMGSLEDVPTALGEFCLRMQADEFWRDHINETVFYGHPPYVSFLCASGVISKWLDSDDEADIDRARWFLRSVAERIPDTVAEVLEPHLLKGGKWPNLILGSLPWNMADDSEKMFQLRLKLALLGSINTSVDWQAASKKHGFRVIKFIEAILSTKSANDNEELSKKRNRIELWYDRDKAAIESVARKFCEETWDLLTPHIERLTKIPADPYDPNFKKWQGKRFEDSKETKFSRGVVELVIEAGRELAAKIPGQFIECTRILAGSVSPITQEILIETFPCLPPTYADNGILWLLARTTRFQIGPGWIEPEWMPAVRLISALSPHCSEEVFKELEKSILDYHSPEEKTDAEYYLHGWKEGHFGNFWGKTQHFLLPALAEKRISAETKALIRVLRRKFSAYSEILFLRGGHGGGGWIGSKLDRNLEKISNAAWLRIISSKKVRTPNNRKWLQVSPDQVLETSIRQFAHSFDTIAKRYPERFARLALQFPVDTDQEYISAIFYACSQTSPDTSYSQTEKDDWRPVTIATVEELLEKFQTSDDRETARSFCRLIYNRNEEKWSDAALSRLVRYAQSHPDPQPDKLNVDCLTPAVVASIDSLFQNTINCVRGVAARGIKHLLWNQPDLYEKLRPGIESLIKDPHPAVRMAAAEMLIPVLNIDKDQAVAWYLMACEGDLRVAASPRGVEFYNYTIPTHLEQIGPLIRKMVISNLDEVAKEGARQVTAHWIFHGCFEEELRLCLTGSVPQRQGVAKVAAELFFTPRHSDQCRKIILPLLNDPDKAVRDKVRHLFWGESNILSNPVDKPLILNYIDSQTFADDPSVFIWHIKERYTGSILFIKDILFGLCETVIRKLPEKSRDMGTGLAHDVSEIVSLILRLYEQSIAENQLEITSRCLDIWDAFFQHRVGIVRELAKAIER